MGTNNPPESGAQKDTRPPLALIAGPTASGKSDLAVQLAEAITETGRPAAIINCDSAQVYADLRVLSARPSGEEMRGIPHYLFGDWDGAAPCSTADWAKAAKAKIMDLHEAGSVPILVGGTGLYMRTLLDGISPIPPIDPEIRTKVRGMTQEAARAALEIEDPEAANRLAAADSARTQRALEVIRSTGKPIASFHGKSTGGIGDQVALHPLIIVPDRAELYERCNLRFEQMLEDGAIDEVKELAQRNLDPELPVMRAIGVREILAWLEEEVSLPECIQSGQQATRQYAKRQYTWFRNQPPDSWVRKELQSIVIETDFELLLR